MTLSLGVRLSIKGNLLPKALKLNPQFQLHSGSRRPRKPNSQTFPNIESHCPSKPAALGQVELESLTNLMRSMPGLSFLEQFALEVLGIGRFRS